MRVLHAIAATLIVAPLAARAGPSAPKATLYALVKGDPAHPLILAVMNELRESVPAGVQRILEQDVSKRLGTSLEAAIVRCGSDLACLSAVGADAGADEVMLLRMLPRGRGVILQLLVVDVQSQKIARKTRIEMQYMHDVKPVVRSKRFEIFGVEPAADEGATPGATATTPLQATEPAASGAVALEASPAAEQAAFPEGEVATLDDPSAFETAPATAAATAAGWRPHAMGYTGIGVAAFGVLATGGSALYYAKSRSLADEIAYGPGGTPQPHAARLRDDSDAAVGRANLFLAIGLAAVVAGSALLGADWLGVGLPSSPPVP